MSELGNRIKGAVDETVGKVKRAIGDATHNDKLHAEGDAQEAKGDLETAAGRTQGAVKETIDRV